MVLLYRYILLGRVNLYHITVSAFNGASASARPIVSQRLHLKSLDGWTTLTYLVYPYRLLWV